MYFDRLEKNLIDIIKEEQAKLGFRKEAIRLYYPLSSLNHFFDAEDSEAEMLTRLSGFPASLTKKLGNVTVTAKKDRFCFHIPEDGSVYVHEHTDANEFIRSLVELLQEHGCTMEDIFTLFKKQVFCNYMNGKKATDIKINLTKTLKSKMNNTKWKF